MCVCGRARVLCSSRLRRKRAGLRGCALDVWRAFCSELIQRAHSLEHSGKPGWRTCGCKTSKHSLHGGPVPLAPLVKKPKNVVMKSTRSGTGYTRLSPEQRKRRIGRDPAKPRSGKGGKGVAKRLSGCLKRKKLGLRPHGKEWKRHKFGIRGKSLSGATVRKRRDWKRVKN